MFIIKNIVFKFNIFIVNLFLKNFKYSKIILGKKLTIFDFC